MGNIETGKHFLDNILKNGIKRGELSIITGTTNLKSNFAKIVPLIDNPKGTHMIHFSLEKKDEVTKHGVCIIEEMIKKCKENGIDTSSIRTNTERINGVDFPVTYFKDGSIIFDYPNPPLK
jgi:hypothetical protein